MGRIWQWAFHPCANLAKTVSIDNAGTTSFTGRHVRRDLENGGTITETLGKKLHTTIRSGYIDVRWPSRAGRNRGGNGAVISICIWTVDSRYIGRTLRAEVNTAQRAKRNRFCDRCLDPTGGRARRWNGVSISKLGSKRTCTHYSRIDESNTLFHRYDCNAYKIGRAHV